MHDTATYLSSKVDVCRKELNCRRESDRCQLNVSFESLSRLLEDMPQSRAP